MKPEMYIVLSGALTFGVPLADRQAVDVADEVERHVRAGLLDRHQVHAVLVLFELRRRRLPRADDGDGFTQRNFSPISGFYALDKIQRVVNARHIFIENI